MNSSKRPPQSGDSPPAVDPLQRDPSVGHEAPEQDQRRGLVEPLGHRDCRAGLYCGGVRMAPPSILPPSRNTCRTIVASKIATGTSGIEYAPLLHPGTAYGMEPYACQERGDRRYTSDALSW